MPSSALTNIEHFLFAQAESKQWPSLVTWLDVDKANSVECELSVPSSLTYFAGHFPGQPVLPGVVQIHWAGEFAKRIFGVSGFSTLQGAKFNGMVMPDTTIRLSLDFKPEKHRVKFAFTKDEQTLSLGSLIFGERLE